MEQSHWQKIRFILKTDPSSFFFLSLLFVVQSILDLLGIGLLSPLVLLINNPAAFNSSSVRKNLSFLEGMSVEKFIVGLGICIICIFIARGVVGVLSVHQIYRHCYQRCNRLISRLVRIHQEVPFELYLQETSSGVINTIVNSTNYFMILVLVPLLQFVASFVVLLSVVLIFSYFLGFYLTVGCFVGLASVLFIYDRFNRAKLHFAGQLVQDSHADIIRNINYIIKGYKEIKVLNKEGHFRNSIEKASGLFSFAVVKEATIRIGASYFIETLLAISIVTALICGSQFAEDTSNIFAIMTVCCAATIRLLPSLKTMSESLAKIRHGTEQVNKLYKILKIGSELNGAPATKHQEMHDFEELRFVDVSYKYPLNEQNSLNNIDIVLKKGEMIGVVGKSGSGKTTLINLILGLLEPKKGEILLNGKKYCRSSLFSLLAYIPQDIFLAEMSVAQNIALGELIIDQERLQQAIHLAHLDEVIQTLPQGIETNIGENGNHISGGQRQRIGIARAFYFQREILVFDEATSALDLETENQIISSLSEFKGIKTIILISHRSSTLENCDRVYQIEDGKVFDRSEVYS